MKLSRLYERPALTGLVVWFGFAWSWVFFTDMLDLQNNLNRVLGFALGKRGASGETTWNPSVDIYRQGENFILKSELPGLGKDDIDITIVDNIVTLKGSKKYESEIKDEDYYHVERLFGSFERSFELPANIDRSKVKALFNNGVLEVTLPLAEESKPKQIKINIE